MKSLKIIILTLSGFLFFTSCLEDNGNFTSYPANAAVVTSFETYPGVLFISTSYGVFAANELKGKYNVGDCLYCSFKINYDSQPSRYYQTASEIKNIQDSPLNESGIVMLPHNSDSNVSYIDTASVDSILAIQFLNNYSSPYVDNHLFLSIGQIASNNQEYEYKLVSYPDSCDLEKIPYLYICAKKTNTSSAAVKETYRTQVFDMLSFVNEYKKDKEIKFYLKYKVGVDGNGNNIYQSATSSPIIIVLESDTE